MSRYVKIREEDGKDGRSIWIPVEEIGASAPALSTDPDPTLNADLKLNNHTIIGALDEQTLVIDGGLL